MLSPTDKYTGIIYKLSLNLWKGCVIIIIFLILPVAKHCAMNILWATIVAIKHLYVEM